MGGVDALVEATTRWYLDLASPRPTSRRRSRPGRDGFERLAAVLGDLGTDERRRRREQTVERLVERRRARGARRARTRCARSSSTRRTWSCGRGRDRAPDRGRRRGVLRRRRRAAARLDRDASSTRVPASDAHAALGAAGRARGRVREAPPRAGPAGAAARRAASRPFLRPSAHERGAAARGLPAPLAREGDRTSPGLTLAVRQLRSLAPASAGARSPVAAGGRDSSASEVIVSGRARPPRARRWPPRSSARRARRAGARRSGPPRACGSARG